MERKELKRLVKETVKFPVIYDALSQTIKDTKGMMVCDIRGWGRIQFMEKSEERQDAIGEVVAKLLNEYGKEHKEHRVKTTRIGVQRHSVAS